MEKARRDVIKEAIKTPIGTTIWLTVAVIILLVIFTLIKNWLTGEKTIDAIIIFLAILPFIIYLVVSGKISEIRGGEFGVKFNNASNTEVSFESEEVGPFKREEVVFTEEVVAKGGVEMLRSEIMPKIAEKNISILSLVPGKRWYSYSAVKQYLEELTKFDFFKYVLFVDENNVFKGYIHARNLLAHLLGSQREEIIEMINSGDIKSIPGFRKEYIRDCITNREALRVMEKERITDIAVVDKDMKFKGFTDPDMITTRFINNLMIKTV